MASYAPEYRLTVYAPRSSDPSEIAVLTPIAGAPTTDAFRVTTVFGSTWGQPYCGLPSGRSGRLDPLHKTVDVGELAVPVLDKKAGAPGDNLTRWVSSFFGDSFGQNRMLGCKAYLEESLDGGASWAAYFTGRISDVKLDKRLQYILTLRDFGEDMSLLSIFVGPPHASITYAQRPSLLPLGLVYPYGTYARAAMLSGTVQASVVTVRNGVSYRRGAFVLTKVARPDTPVTQELLDALPPQPNVPLALQFSPMIDTRYVQHFVSEGGSARCLLASSSAGTSGEFVMLGYLADTILTAGCAATLFVEELARASSSAPDPPKFLALPADGTALTGYAYLDTPPAGPLSSLIIGGSSQTIHPVQLWADILDGKYGYLWKWPETLPPGSTVAYGDPKRRIPYSTSAFAALIADPSFGTARFAITATAKMTEWIAKHILQPYQLCYYFGANGALVPVDLRRPQTLPSNVLADADLIEGRTPAWEYAIDSAITRVNAKYYEDFPYGTAADRLTQNPPGPGVVVQGSEYFSALTHELILPMGRSDVAENALEIDAQGMRGMRGEVWYRDGWINPTSDAVTGSRLIFLRDKLAEFAYGLEQPFGAGAQTVSLPCRRTTAADLRPGDLTLSTISLFPDPATNKRGGTRLLRITERQDMGLERTLKAVDMGLAVAAAAPTLTGLAQQTGNTQHGAEALATVNAAGQMVEVHRNVTSTAVAAAPATSDGGWVRVAATTATGKVTAQGLPGGSRVWMRARTLPGSLDAPQQPSSWIPASAPAFVDLAVLAGPTALATSSVSARTANYGFTAGDPTMLTAVYLAEPSTTVPIRMASLPPYVTRGRLTLTPNSSYQLTVYAEDGFGGVSPSTSVIFSTPASSASMLTAPQLPNLTILVGA